VAGGPRRALRHGPDAAREWRRIHGRLTSPPRSRSTHVMHETPLTTDEL
jgi:hypothetical protein